MQISQIDLTNILDGLVIAIFSTVQENTLCWPFEQSDIVKLVYVLQIRMAQLHHTCNTLQTHECFELVHLPCIQLGTGSCSSIQLGAGSCSSIQLGAGSCSSIQLGAGSCSSIKLGTLSSTLNITIIFRNFLCSKPKTIQYVMAKNGR